MIRSCACAVTGVLFAIATQAAPAIYPHQVVNAASYYTPGLPGASIAQGSIFYPLRLRIGTGTGCLREQFSASHDFFGRVDSGHSGIDRGECHSVVRFSGPN